MIRTHEGVLLDESSPTTEFQSRNDVVIPAGEDFDLKMVVKREDGTAVDMTGGQLLLTVKERGNPDPVISRQATPTRFATGLGFFELVPDDTLLLLGPYTWDVWFTDVVGNVGTARKRYRVVPLSSWVVSAANGQPDQDVTVPGPPISPFVGFVTAVRRTISQPADGSDFFVAISGQADDLYRVVPQQVKTSAFVGIVCLDDAPTDRTSSQFRAVSTSPLSDGDVVDFLIFRS